MKIAAPMTRSPSFIAHFADGEVTRMSVYAADPRKLDYVRGVNLAVQAYRSRCRTEPPAIVKASFQRGDTTLVEYTAEELEAAGSRPVQPKPKRVKRKARPKPKAPRPTLNAIGRPYSPLFDPKYRLRHKPQQRTCRQTGDLFLFNEEAER
jgi:hypothetical protein